MTVDDDEAAAFYEDPGHRRITGPWVWRRVRPGLKSLRYDNPEHDPRNSRTLNAGSQPYWVRNPDVPS